MRSICFANHVNTTIPQNAKIFTYKSARENSVNNNRHTLYKWCLESSDSSRMTLCSIMAREESYACIEGTTLTLGLCLNSSDGKIVRLLIYGLLK